MIRHSTPAFLAVYLLLFIVCLGPLPFGSVLVPGRTALGLCALAAFVCALLTSDGSDGERGALLACLPVAAVGGLGLLQSLSWPRAVVAVLAPRLAEDWAQAARLLGEESARFALSQAPEVSRGAAFHWLAVAAAAAAATLTLRQRPQRRLVLGALLALAVFEVFYGTGVGTPGSGRIWGVEVGGDPNRLRGTFVNANHAALYLSLAVTTAFAGLWWSIRRARWERSIESRILLFAGPSLLFLLLFVGLAFTGSRGGLVAVVLALLLQALLMAAPQKQFTTGLAALAGIGVLGIGGVVWFGFEQGFGRLLATSGYEIAWGQRLLAWRAAWQLFTGAPWTGCGLGTFRQAFPAVQPADLEGTWSHAHNDPLEILVTTGLVGFLLLAAALALVTRQLWHRLNDGRRSEDHALALAGAGALAAALLHSLVDFGLTIPANAFTLAILLGMAITPPTRSKVSSREA
jgi:O-antigen ligase